MNLAFRDFRRFVRSSLVASASPCALEALESRRLLALTAFTIDPAQSFLRLSGEVAGTIDLEEQSSGSLKAAYEGTLLADVDGATLSFPGGSDIIAQAVKSYDPGSEPANYGGEGETGGFFSVKVGDAAIRGLELDLSSDDPVALAENGGFDASSFTIRTTAGRLEYDLLTGVDGSFDLDGQSVANNAAGTGTLRGTGQNLTLTLPINVIVDYDEAELRFAGTLVATSGEGAPADFNAARVGVGGSKKVVFTDENGTIAAVSLKGGGTADLTFENATTQTTLKSTMLVGGTGLRLLAVDAVGTRASSNLQIRGSGGADGVVEVGRITTDSAVAAVGGSGLALTGTLDVPGGIGKLTAARMSAATVTADAVGKLAVSRDITASAITLDAPVATGVLTAGQVKVGGAITGSRLTFAGNVGTLKATGMAGSEVYAGVSGASPRLPLVSSDFESTAQIAKVQLKTFADSVIAAGGLGAVKLGRIGTDFATPFGISADLVTSLIATNAAGKKLKLVALGDQAAADAALAAVGFDAAGFELRLV